MIHANGEVGAAGFAAGFEEAEVPLYFLFFPLGLC